MKNIDYETYKKLPFFKKPFYKAIPHYNSVEEAYNNRPKKWIYNLVYTLIILGFIMWFAIDLDLFDKSSHVNWIKFGNMSRNIFAPNWSYFFGYGLFSFKTSVIYQVIETFAIAFIGTTVASILSLPFGFLASHKMVGKSAFVSETILIVIRTFPEILLGYIMVKVVGYGALAGVFVLSLHSIGMIGKMYAEQLDLVSNDPLEALEACGAGFVTKVKLGVVPQVKPNFLSVILYRFDLNIRTASLLGLVGAGGVGYPISTYGQNEHWNELSAVLLGVIILVIAVDLVSSKLRKKLI